MSLTSVLEELEVNGGKSAGRKIILLGLFKREGKVYAKIISIATQKQILPIIRATVRSGSDIYADGWSL